MSRMFKTITQTWNPQTGCLWNCRYCWAKKLAQKFGWADFKPQFHPNRLNKRFKPEDFVFVTSMGDICFASPDAVRSIKATIAANPQTKFLIQTKNPAIFLKESYGENTYHGVTLETNREYNVSRAPIPVNRFAAMMLDEHPHKFLSVEPVMDFDLDTFLGWIKQLNPEIIEIGGDNYQNNLPEPSPEKLRSLLDGMRAAGLKVKEKDGLSRLLNSVALFEGK